MAKVQLKTRAGIEFMAEGADEAVQNYLDRFLQGSEPNTVQPITQPKVLPQGATWDVVAIYDEAGIPSIMHRFRRTTNKDLFGGSEKDHPAFIIGGRIVDAIYIGVYESCNIGGKPYSLPHMKAWTNISHDDAAEACYSKGAGWHMVTAPEWGLLANLSLKNGTLPHGNTSGGKYHADKAEHGEIYDGGYTLTGSGPATWTHDHTPTGVHDLCGNVWEMIRGLRIKDGRLQAAVNNDAALADTDLSPDGAGWQPIYDDDGETLAVSIDDEGIKICTATEIEQDYAGREWENVTVDTPSEQLKELAIYAGEPDAYCYIDSTDGEYLPIRGGHWLSGADAGVFALSLGDPRSNVSATLGFRVAYFGDL